MQIDDNASETAQSAKMELWPFASNSRQAWKFESLENGYYKITSKASGLALSVKSGKENSKDSALIQETYVGANRQQWEVVSGTLNGAVIIKPRSNTNFRMAMGGGIFTYDGRNVEQRQSQSGNGDEWYMQPIDNYAHITLPARIYYDSTLLQDTTVEELQQAYSNATRVLLEGCHIKFDVSIIEYSDLLDPATTGCDVSHTLDSVCTSLCGDLTLCSTLHHRSSSRMIHEYLVSNQHYTTRAVGYTICSYKDGTHHPVGGLAVLSGKDSIVTNNFGETLATLIQHELLHNLGLDHCGRLDCIMGNNKIDHLCNTCKSDLWDFVLS